MIEIEDTDGSNALAFNAKMPPVVSASGPATRAECRCAREAEPGSRRRPDRAAFGRRGTVFDFRFRAPFVAPCGEALTASGEAFSVSHSVDMVGEVGDDPLDRFAHFHLAAPVHHAALTSTCASASAGRATSS